jgi:acetyltransferase-like isoleucine patch superfamily enzyme
MISVGNINHKQLFSTKLSLVYWNITNNFNDELNKIAKENNNYIGVNHSKKKEYFSIYEINKSKTLLELVKMVQEGVKIYMQENLQINNDLYDISINANVRIEKNSDFAYPHKHLGSDLVVTYYSKIYKNTDETSSAGSFVFLNPNSLMMFRPLNKELTTFEIPPTNNLMVISPSYANHMTVPFSNSLSEKIVWIHNIKIIPKEKELNANYLSVKEIEESRNES